MPQREDRIERTMKEEGCDRMQAINFLRNQDARRSLYSRKPRSFDFRFGAELGWE